MSRPVLEEAKLHPAIREHVAQYGAGIVKEVQDAIAANAIVVVGMAFNPFPKKACKALDAAGYPYRYLQYGSYFNGWRRRIENVDRVVHISDGFCKGNASWRLY